MEYFCHSCLESFDQEEAATICPSCQSEFIEQIEADNDPRQVSTDEEGPHPENMLQGIVQLLYSSMNEQTPQVRVMQTGPNGGLVEILQMLGTNAGLASNLGDYVFGQRGLDDIITQLMEQAAEKNAPPPADEQTIANLQKVSVQQPEDKKLDCSICQEVYQEDEVVTELNCKHLFHTPCIEYWLKLNGTCPVCRAKVMQSETAT